MTRRVIVTLCVMRSALLAALGALACTSRPARREESGMSARRMVATLLVLSMFMMSGAGLVRAVDAQPAVPPAPGGTPAPVQSTEATPARVGYVNGEVSFWRPGAQ